MDNKFIDTFGVCFEHAKPLDITSELRLFKLVIHEEFSEKYGTKTPSSTKSSHRTEKLADERKDIRKRKRASKKSYKKANKDGCSDEIIAERKTEWRKLLKLHNIIRNQEQELKNKRAEIKNNSAFNRDPFCFMKDEVTKGKQASKESSCSLESAEQFFSD